MSLLEWVEKVVPPFVSGARTRGIYGCDVAPILIGYLHKVQEEVDRASMADIAGCQLVVLLEQYRTRTGVLIPGQILYLDNTTKKCMTIFMGTTVNVNKDIDFTKPSSYKDSNAIRYVKREIQCPQDPGGVDLCKLKVIPLLEFKELVSQEFKR